MPGLRNDQLLTQLQSQLSSTTGSDRQEIQNLIDQIKTGKKDAISAAMSKLRTEDW